MRRLRSQHTSDKRRSPAGTRTPSGRSLGLQAREYVTNKSGEVTIAFAGPAGAGAEVPAGVPDVSDFVRHLAQAGKGG